MCSGSLVFDGLEQKHILWDASVGIIEIKDSLESHFISWFI
ncbi:hypothetical protein V6Z11_D07G105000 [Gossypium hirsutum]